jgi:glycosyltransferase involved in cell wall biosynthesis
MNEPIRVLELRSVWGTGGGPEKTILAGTARTDPARFVITVCYLRDLRDAVFHIDTRAGVLPIDYVEVRERHSFDFRIWGQLRSLVRERRFHIVHAHDYKTDLLALLLGCSDPVIPLSTAHGWAGHSWKEEHIYNPGDRRLLCWFPRVIVVSADMRDALIGTGAAPDRITVVPNGIDEQMFTPDPSARPTARQALGLRADDIVIGAVGRLESEKNYPLLMEAFAGLLPAHPRLRLLVAGDGGLRSHLERRAGDLGLEDRFRLLGHVPDVRVLHRALDVFVMCSDNEGSPNALLEAMALGTPIVATDVGGVADLVRDGEEALLVPRRDLAALTSAIATAVTDTAASAVRARAARRKVEGELSFGRRMRKVEEVYEELLERYPGVCAGRRWWNAASR